ncbi:unnamed protein product, partial [marine sediment metagenome]
TQPKAVLKLVRRIVKRQPEMVPWALNTALEGLAHEADDVQELAVELLESWASRAHGDHAASLRERFDDLAPTLRARAENLLREMGDDGAAADQESGVDEAADLSLLFEQAESLDAHWSKLAGVDVAVAAIRAGDMPDPLEFNLLDVPVLSSLDPIEPIQTVDELLDAVAHALEDVDSADELERILDGISRLCDQRPEDFEQRAAPLIQRLQKVQSSESARGLFTSWHTLESLQQMIFCWLSGERVPKSQYSK